MADMPKKHADNSSLAGAVNMLGESELQMTRTNWGNALKQVNKTEDTAYKNMARNYVCTEVIQI